MMRYMRDVFGAQPADATGFSGAVVTASWEFHPPGVIRIVTPAEHAAQAGRDGATRAEHDATGDDR